MKAPGARKPITKAKHARARADALARHARARADAEAKHKGRHTAETFPAPERPPERATAIAKVFEIVLGEDRVAIACELATARNCSLFNVVTRAFDEHVAKSGKGEALERISQKKRRR